jgi:hypothetical protein
VLKCWHWRTTVLDQIINFKSRWTICKETLSGTTMTLVSNHHTFPNPVKLLHDGSILINFSEGREGGLGSVLRDIDLARNTNWQITAPDLTQALLVKRLFQRGKCYRFEP